MDFTSPQKKKKKRDLPKWAQSSGGSAHRAGFSAEAQLGRPIGSAARAQGPRRRRIFPGRLHLPAWPGGWATDERAPPAGRLLPRARSRGGRPSGALAWSPAVPAVPDGVRRIGGLGRLSRAHLWVSRRLGRTEATAALAPAGGFESG